MKSQKKLLLPSISQEFLEIILRFV